MKIIKTLFWLLLLLIPVGAGLLALNCLESAPLVVESEKLTPDRVARAQELLKEHDPRKLKNHDTKTITLSAQELSLIGSHLIQHLGTGNAVVSLQRDQLDGQASIKIPGLKSKNYINIDASLLTRDDTLTITNLQIGKNKIPKALANAMAKFGVMHLYRAAEISDLNDVIQAVKISANQFAVTYRWQENLIDAVRGRVFSAEEIESLERFNGHLAAMLENSPSRVTLEAVVENLFQHVDQTLPAVKENRAVIITLSNYVSGRRMSALIPSVEQWPSPKRVKLISHGRHDLSQHFATSAGLAIAGGDKISDAIGLYKELDDSDGGSGFSFKDLAADRSGTEFARYAVSSEKAARRLQQVIASGIGSDDLIPNLEGLEENMSDREFKARYGGIEGAKYLQMASEIDRRVAALRIYQ